MLDNFGEEEIHDFRLEYKKIRAFIRLTNEGNRTNKKIKLPGKIKYFYRRAGNIRNLQLYKHKISIFCDFTVIQKPKNYFNRLDSLIERESKEALKGADHLQEKNITKSVSKEIPYEINDALVQSLIKRYSSELAALLSVNPPSDQILHGTRKILKDILFNSKYIQADLQSIAPDLSVKNIKELSITLGDFMDICVDLGLLNQIPEYGISKVEKSLLRDFETRLIFIKDRLKGEILNEGLFTSFLK